MSVQAHYQSNSNVLPLNISELEMKTMNESALLFSNGGIANPREPQNQPINLLSLQSQTSVPPRAPAHLTLDRIRNGLQRSQSLINQSNNPLLSSSLSEDLAAQINQHKEEIDQLLRAQEEQLRRTLEERRKNHYRALLVATQESVARRLREKNAEVEQAVRRTGELQSRLAQLKMESLAWQAKAMEEQQSVASLKARLQHATAAVPTRAKGEGCGESAAEDAESVYIDPDRTTKTLSSACHECWERPASVVLFPCRHLCLCADCDVLAAPLPCPVCRSVRTGSIQVFLS